MYFVVLMNAFAEITIRDAKLHFYYGKERDKFQNVARGEKGYQLADFLPINNVLVPFTFG